MPTDAYNKLQRHFHKHPLGFPETEKITAPLYFNSLKAMPYRNVQTRIFASCDQKTIHVIMDRVAST